MSWLAHIVFNVNTVYGTVLILDQVKLNHLSPRSEKHIFIHK